MDPITHGLLGASLSKITKIKSDKNNLLWFGALTAMSPDLDVFIPTHHIPSLMMLYHRNFTHSLIFAPLGGLICAMLWILLFREKKRLWLPIIFLGIFVYYSHPFLDAATSYGTQLFWPVSHERVAWDIISIVDPIFTFFLFCGIFASGKQFGSRPALIGLGLAFLYLLFGTYQHHRAMLAQENLANTRQQIATTNNRVMPDLFHLFQWRSYYIFEKFIYVDLINTPFLQTTKNYPGVRLPQFTEAELPAVLQKDNSIAKKDFEILNWFSDGYITKISTQPLVITDLRFAFRFKPLGFSWSVVFPNNPDKHALWWSGS